MKKKGQFYLAAAVVLITIIVSLSAVYTSVRASQKNSSPKLLAAEIQYESAQLLENGARNNLAYSAISANIESLSDYYASTNSQSDFLIVHGDEETFTFIFYNNTGKISPAIIINSENILAQSQGIEKKQVTIDRTGIENAEIIFDNNPFTYKFRSGRFVSVFVDSQQEGEKFIVVEE